jgi:hypothetical protein
MQVIVYPDGVVKYVVKHTKEETHNDLRRRL